MPVQYGGAPPSAPFYFTQSFSSLSQWNVIHNLGKKPSVSIVLPNGEVVYTDMVHVDANTVVLTWPSPMTGTVVCS